MTSQDPNGFEQVLQQALAASQQNDSVNALRLFAEASAIQPQSGIPHFLSGAEYAQLGKLNEAEAAFANAVLLAPQLTIARFQLGLLQFTSGRAAMALVTWENLFQLPENDPLGLFARGFAELAQDHFEQALALFERGIQHNQANPPLNKDIAMVMAEIRKVLGQAPSEPQAEAATTENNADAFHFLLGSYTQNNRLH